MADNQTPEAPSQRGGRRRGRGGAGPSGRVDSQNNADGEKRSKPRTRGSGRGGGDSGRQNRKNEQTSDKDTQPKPTVTSATKKPVEAATDDADDGEVCFICASPVEHTSVSPCNHRTCHICALRLRALYKNKACAHCRVRYILRVIMEPLKSWYANRLLRRNRTLLYSRMTLHGDMKSSRRRTSLGRTRTWGSNTRTMRSSETRCFCSDTTAQMRTAMWLAWGGQIYTAMSRRNTTR